MKELAQRFIDKECLFYSFDGRFLTPDTICKVLGKTLDELFWD